MLLKNILLVAFLSKVEVNNFGRFRIKLTFELGQIDVDRASEPAHMICVIDVVVPSISMNKDR